MKFNPVHLYIWQKLNGLTIKENIYVPWSGRTDFPGGHADISYRDSVLEIGYHDPLIRAATTWVGTALRKHMSIDENFIIKRNGLNFINTKFHFDELRYDIKTSQEEFDEAMILTVLTYC